MVVFIGVGLPLRIPRVSMLFFVSGLEMRRVNSGVVTVNQVIP
jgi:hypothetical protein